MPDKSIWSPSKVIISHLKIVIFNKKKLSITIFLFIILNKSLPR